MKHPIRIIASAQVDKSDRAVVGCDDDVNNLLTRFELLGAPMSGQSVMIPPYATARQFSYDVLLASAEAWKIPGITIIIYSGHGGRVPDDNGDERTKLFQAGYDSTLCFCDRQMRDDECGRLLATFPATEWIYFIVDACHSGSMFRAFRPVYKGFLFRKSEEITARVAYFGGCQDKGYSSGYPNGGAATLDLSYVLDVSNDITVGEWYYPAKDLTIARGEGQIPSVVWINDNDKRLRDSKLLTRPDLEGNAA